MKLRVLFSLVLSFTVLVLNAQNQLYIGPYSGNTTSPGRISATGTLAELSVTNRAVNSFVESPANGERWVIYNSGPVSDGRLRFWSGGDKVVFTKEGRVGIGIDNPSAQLHLASDSHHELKISRASGMYGFRIFRNAAQGTFYFQNTDNNNNWGTRIRIEEGGDKWQDILLNPDGGNVGIGTFNTGSYKLAVEGKIGAREVKVTTASWADFVFADDYVLPPLAEVEQFIKKHKHLPEVPSEKDVLENGIELGKMDAILLQKIEELTLYMINQQKEITELKEMNDRMKEEIIQLKLVRNR